MCNPADEHICDLIEHLAVKARKFTTSAEDRQTCISQIAQLRAAMSPLIIQENQD